MSGPRRPEAPLSPDIAGPRLAGAVTALSLLGLLGCGFADRPPSPEPEAPEGIERESWDVQLELRGNASSVAVEAAYVADLPDGITRADGGVTVTFIDSQGGPATRIRAEHLLIDHGQDVVGFSGDVVAEAGGPGVTARADSLTWDRRTDRLDAAAADLILPDGRLRAGRLDGGSDLASWSATDVAGAFSGSRGRAEDPAALVHIEAASAALQVHGGQVAASFDQVRSRWRDRRFAALRARYEGRSRRMVLEGSASMVDSGRGRRLLADVIDIELSRSRFAAAGDVRVEGEARLWAETIEEDGDRWRVQGDPARAEVDGRTLRARRLYVSEGTDTVMAAGEVSAWEGGRRITADSLCLARPEDEVEAFGAVRVAADDLEGDLRSRRLRSGAAGDRLVMWREARLTRSREYGGDLTLRADSLILDRSQQHLDAIGAFLLESPPAVELRARRGVYDTQGGAAALFGEVEFLHHTEAGTSRLVSDSSRLELADGGPVALTWPDDLRGRLRGSGETWLSAGSGRAALVSGRLSSLALEGRVEAVHRGPSEERLSRFTAERMELSFDDAGSLRQVLASGAAQVRLRLSEGGREEEVSLNEIEGEGLEIDLQEGVVQTVRVLDEVEGRFEPTGRGD